MSLYTSVDFAAAFNEWAHRSREDPDRMKVWMQEWLETHNNDEGKACAGLLFSILQDLKRSNNEHV